MGCGKSKPADEEDSGASKSKEVKKGKKDKRKGKGHEGSNGTGTNGKAHASEQRNSFKHGRVSGTGDMSSDIVKNPTAVQARAHMFGQKVEDDYVIDKKHVLGTGFCGSVFMAESKTTGEKVAVKVLQKSDFTGGGSETEEEIMKRVT